jgi:cytochrome c553
MKKGGSSDSASDTVPGDDADRPTLRKRRSDKKDKPRGDEPEVEKVGSGLNDPNRPIIHRGKPTGTMTEEDIPKLLGLPPEKQLHQIVAVSDAVDRPTHDFAREWEGPDERAEVLMKLQNKARAELAAYGAAHPSAGPPATSKPETTHRPGTPSRRSPAKRTAPAPEPPAPVTLLDEDLRGFELSYNGTPTFVYTAHTEGVGAARKDVTLVAQMNPKGDPEYAIKSVTDEGHLDQTPRMRLVDAVDADASNRASLLFELKAQNTRQFALYRVIGARAEQVFTTGTTQ